MADEPASGELAAVEVVDSGIDLDEPDVVEARSRPGNSAGRRRPTPGLKSPTFWRRRRRRSRNCPPSRSSIPASPWAPAAFDEPLSDESVIGTMAEESGLDLGEAIIVDSSVDLAGAALVEGASTRRSPRRAADLGRGGVGRQPAARNLRRGRRAAGRAGNGRGA